MVKKSLTEIGSTVPQNFKFGLIVLLVIFWADVLKSFLREIFHVSFFDSALTVNLAMAIIITSFVYLLLLSYRKVYYKLKKVKV